MTVLSSAQVALLTRHDPGGPADDRLAAVLCGSFHRHRDQLLKTFDELAAAYDVLAPRSVEFCDPNAEFVRLSDELNRSVDEIEWHHLAALRRADFVWLFCPDGYVGHSASLEVGYATAIGIPVMTDCQPEDPVIASMVRLVDDIKTAGEHIACRPGEGVAGLQAYYGRIAARRGWDQETPQDTLLLITEELGELARAVRKSSGLIRDGVYPETDLAEEIADVQLYLVHLANALGVDLAEAVSRKEAVNADRHAKRSSAA